MKKLVSVILTLVLCLTACAALAEGVSGKVYACNTPGLIDAMGWYTLQTYTLQLNEDSTYQLTYRFDAFGANDLDTRGSSVMILKGTWTDAEPEDEENGHRDVTLSSAESVYFNQVGKIFGRSGGNKVLDTDNWTDEMTAKAEMDCAAFLATYGAETVVVIEEPELDPMDDTLLPQIFEIDIPVPEVKS